MLVNEVVAAAIIGTLLRPPACSLALSSGVSKNAHEFHYIQRLSASSSRKYPLSAVAENHVVAECRKVNGVIIDVPTSPGSMPLHNDSTEYGEENTSRSSGMTDMHDFRGTEAGINAGEVVEKVLSEFDKQFGDIDANSCDTNKKNENKSDRDNLDELCDFDCWSENSRILNNQVTNIPVGYRIRSVIAKSAVFRRAGIVNDVRSSQAKAQHLNKSRKLNGNSHNANAIARVLCTARSAAASVAAEERQSISLTSESFSSNLKSVIESTVAEIMKFRDSPVNQQSVDVSSCIESPPLFPPPGATSMGILGDVVQDKLYAIPPIPGTCLISASGDFDDSKVTIRTSIPHSSDDTHIANLRLSVFSRFDEEQQQMFRRQSIEVLNYRRKRGAVVLVAEAKKGRIRSDYLYLNEMQSRILLGYKYGEKYSYQQHGQRPVAVSVPCPTFVDVQSRETEKGLIIGSVECSHQEFRGTLLGNSRPKGSLMYVTEVAVRSDARRCGAGAMLMRGVVEVATLRNIESIYLHVDVTNQAARSMYEKCGFHYLDMRNPIYAQFTASLNLHDGAIQGRKHYMMCKNLVERLTWLKDSDSSWTCFSQLS